MKIPAGVDEGDRIRLSGEGEAGVNGGPPGDLYVVIHLKAHSVFQRDGDDLHCEMPISFTQAALGGEIEIPTLDGSAKVKVPPETQTGQVFRLRGKGIKGVRSAYPGDLLCEVVVETPVRLTERQRELLRELEEINRKDGEPPQPARQELHGQGPGVLRRLTTRRASTPRRVAVSLPVHRQEGEQWSEHPRRARAGRGRACGRRDRRHRRARSSSASRPCSRARRRTSGTQMRDGALAYFDYVNSQGGVNGRKIVLKSVDDRYEPDGAVAATKKLIEEDKVFALFGYVGTPTYNAAAAHHQGSASPAGGRVHGRRVAARPDGPLRLQRARELLRRDRADRAAPHVDGHRQDRRLLPERRLRQGGPRMA